MTVRARISSSSHLGAAIVISRRAFSRFAENGPRRFLLRTSIGARRRSLWPVTLLSTQSIDNNTQHDQQQHFLTNDGTVEGVWIFFRHGDRTPSRSLSPAHRYEHEASFWVSKLPFPDSAAAYECLSTRFPLVVPEEGTNQGKFIDVVRNPFGFLTQTGLHSLSEIGHRFFNRYNHHGHHLPGQSTWRWEVAQDFLSVWDVKVFSTNYFRTVMSAQSFLDGLLGTQCYLPAATRRHDPTILRELRVPSHSWRRIQGSTTAPSSSTACDITPLVPVEVRELKHDPLNAFDRNPDLMAELVSEVMMSAEFRERDSQAAPLAARLANILPGLVRPRRADFSQRSPSGINWVEAADHFVCRAAHGVMYSRFSDFEHDERIEQTLAAMSHQTLAHLAWRFRQWYRNERLLAAIAAPPLREVADQLERTPDMEIRERRPFVMYSCHDITILGLLYGIGAEFLAKGSASAMHFWPHYGATLTFELVRIRNGPPTLDSHVVRVLLNGKPVISVDFEKTDLAHGSPTYLGAGPERMLRVTDFMDLIGRLEKAGGHDYDSLLGRR